MVRPGDRRPMITDHAIVVLADGGARALTHQAVDRHAGLPAGSTSYYFRTRAALIAAVVERIRVHSRTAFDNAQAQSAGPVTAEGAAALIAGQLRNLTGERWDQALAVFALLGEVREQPELRDALMRCLFSVDLATGLLGALGSAAPEADAADLIDLLTGRLVGLLFGADDRSPEQVEETVTRLLRRIR
ncbi:TetR family transcriptional regulator [Gordonia sp. (in: high G+C Gram-positive bacteria)]|uniref:TetR/AcrR family transcriptional regulator n=1 Tax=Gordonia sp. (in: high G+C Gram-positive bacteria) TaxID=84139 RepID=UPI001DE321E0|nr:TetR family transcriptional regulator [Gordonia sp. (in: high G+C Gram-positive bacteria)]MCB1295785.1 TetR family transcriptional regulator [Gordonia sp. (in: high G+C Gram-positive bacteria)]HMS77417.1 TetR family transcriptional regulator [Gordonia sp. (in: high G+C Gram-positive bacteria)]